MTRCNQLENIYFWGSVATFWFSPTEARAAESSFIGGSPLGSSERPLESSHSGIESDRRAAGALGSLGSGERPLAGSVESGGAGIGGSGSGAGSSGSSDPSGSSERRSDRAAERGARERPNDPPRELTRESGGARERDPPRDHSIGRYASASGETGKLSESGSRARQRREF